MATFCNSCLGKGQNLNVFSKLSGAGETESDNGLGEHTLRTTPTKLTFLWLQSFSDFGSFIHVINTPNYTGIILP